MTGAELYAPGDLRVEEVEKPVPKPGEALIKVEAVGICGSDLDRVMKTGTYHFPLIPGHEFSGSIEKIYAGEKETSFKEGDRVVVAPIIPCGTCVPCQHGYYGLCEHYDYIGSRRNGAFAEYVTAPVKNLIALPESISFKEGAVVEPAAVVLHGLRNAKIEAGDTVCVLGCGSIGLLAVQLSKALGAVKVIASDIDEEKLALAKTLGADIAVNPSKQDLEDIVKKQTARLGADAVIETAGSPFTQEQCLYLGRFKARVLLLGTAHRDVTYKPVSYEKIIRKELVLYGSWNSYSAPFPGIEWQACIDYIRNGKLNIKPMISHVISLKELPQMIADMSQRKLSFTKVLVSFE